MILQNYFDWTRIKISSFLKSKCFLVNFLFLFSGINFESYMPLIMKTKKTKVMCLLFAWVVIMPLKQPLISIKHCIKDLFMMRLVSKILQREDESRRSRGKRTSIRNWRQTSKKHLLKMAQSAGSVKYTSSIFAERVRLPQQMSGIWHKTIGWWSSSNAGTLGNSEYPFIPLACRFTLAWSGNIW